MTEKSKECAKSTTFSEAIFVNCSLFTLPVFLIVYHCEDKERQTKALGRKALRPNTLFIHVTYIGSHII